MKLYLIAAMTESGVIGLNGEIPWYVPEDLQHFKNTTLGNFVIIGRKTFDALPESAYEGRVYLVLTSNPDFLNKKRDGILYFNDVESVLQYCQTLQLSEKQKIYVAGGENVYNQFIDICDLAMITYIDLPLIKGDNYFPIRNLITNFAEIGTRDWKESRTGIKHKVVGYKRKVINGS